jgi:hypothetical protein
MWATFSLLSLADWIAASLTAAAPSIDRPKRAHLARTRTH